MPVFAQQSLPAAPPSPLMVQPVRPADPVASSIAQWRALTQSATLPFSSYASFMVANKGWPGETAMRKNAEAMLRADGESPQLVVNFFRAFAPMTPTAKLRFAEALDATGDRAAATEAARAAWTSGALTPQDESRLLTRYGSQLRTIDHDTRMDKLLWSRATAVASRQLGMTSAENRAMFAARLAFLNKASDAASLAEQVDASRRTDPGYVADRIFWLRSTGQGQVARAVLASRQSFFAPPADPAKWLAIKEGVMRDAEAEGQWSTVYGIGATIGDAYAPGVIVRDRSFAERDAYTDITWMAGMAALEKLGRPADAVRMFDLYAAAARSPQTRSKGLYWAGRAAERAGQRDMARSFFMQASAFVDQFHGQLAFEKLGQPLAIPPEAVTIEISSSQRDLFERSGVVRATRWLGQSGNWQDQTKFVRALAANAVTAEEHALIAELAGKINRQDLALLIGRSAREKGYPGYLRFSFPTLKVPDEHAGNWTVIHAITRQESQFDREAQSPVGARGLMQLMPGTARQTAPAAGVSYDLASLTRNPQDNMRLGSTYFGQLMTTYNGSYLLSVAAYNAGPGNVNKWIRANGDPRLPGTDVIAWIEKIPFTETRNYVQRVLENVVVYDLMNPMRPPARKGVALSALLGRSQSSFGSP